MRTLVAVLCLVAIGLGPCPAEANDRTIVALRGRDDAGLRALVAAQQDPARPEYRRWVTRSEFGRRFGAAPRELKRVERWLRASGCRVKRFSSLQQVSCVGGRPGDVPTTLRPLVEDVLDPATPLELHFNLTRDHLDPRSLFPNGAFFLSPDEYAAFFGYSGLHAAGIDGTGQHIGIVGAAGADSQDIDVFRQTFNLRPIDFEQVNLGTSTAPRVWMRRSKRSSTSAGPARWHRGPAWCWP